MMNQDELLDILDKRYSTDNKGDYFHVGMALTAGVVVDTDDPLQMGRLRVYCASHGDSPEKILELPWAIYISPFGGTISNPKYERDGKTTVGAQSYGFWAIPELGANVLVGCIDGDLRRRFWMGSMYDQQETHTLGNGRYNWSSGGQVDGPLSSAGQPVQPSYDNATTAFSGKKNSPEWQSRQAEYSGTAVDKKVNQPPTPSKSSYLDQQHDEISAAQQFSFNQAIVGENGYDWSGFGGLPFKSSKTIGFTSPGFASFTMDDRQFNMRTKFRSATGHLILLDDTNDRIYVRTNTGNAWAELDSAGNVDVYASRRISLNADMDININSKQTVRIKGTEGVYIYAGDTTSFPELTAAPASGQVRIQAQDDMHLVSNNLRQLSVHDTIFEIGGNKCETVNGTSKTQVQGDIDLITNAGDFNTTITGNYNLLVSGSINEFAILGAKVASKGNVEFYAYYGTVNIGAQQDITAKSISGSINVQAVGGNSGNQGSVNIKAPNSQMSVNTAGATISTNGGLGIQTGQGVNMQAQSQSQQAQPIPASQVPDPSCSVATPVPLTGTGVDLATEAAYNAGFRGQSLVTIVAIAGAESQWNPNAIGDVALETAKWGPSCGFWQVRSLVSPSSFSYPDTLRDKNQLFDPQFNANAAYAFSKQGTNFGAWSTYMGGQYLTHVTDAVAAINRLCGNVTPTPSPVPQMVNNPMNMKVEDISGESINQNLLFTVSPLKPSIILTDTDVIIQTLNDVIVSSVNSGTTIAILAGIKTTSDITVAKCNELASAVNSCCDNAIQSITPIPESGITAPVEQIPSTYIPYVEPDSEVVFNLENFDLNGGTIIT
jgi:uncharacterized protein (DUF2345 family)